MLSLLISKSGPNQNSGIGRFRSVSQYESALRARVRARCLRTAAQHSTKMAKAGDPAQLNAAAARDHQKGHISAKHSVAVAVAHWTGHSDHVEVPSKWSELHWVFWLHPTPVAAICIILGLVLGISSQPSLGILDCGALFLGVAIWAVQEWAIHKHLFHGDINWFGKAIHTDHHKAPYYHISIDDAFIAVGVMLLSTAAFTVTLGARCGMDASLGYILAGLCYQFTHYSVHCRFVPSSKLARRIRSHHMQHHCRNENYWLSFTLPQIDTWMNTNPSPSSVPMTEMAKAAVQNKK